MAKGCKYLMAGVYHGVSRRLFPGVHRDREKALDALARIVAIADEPSGTHLPGDAEIIYDCFLRMESVAVEALEELGW